MFFKKHTESVQWIVIGLGNPEKAHTLTRHNVGFMAVDALGELFGKGREIKKFSSDCFFSNVEGQSVLFMKPKTYMNLSGDAAAAAKNWFKLPPERLLVIFDDVALPFGKLRIRTSGSHGGHNGIRDIIEKTGTNGFPRVKIGVGGSPNPGYDLKDWVLSRFSSAEISELNTLWESIAAAVELIVAGKTDQAMSKFN